MRVPCVSLVAAVVCSGLGAGGAPLYTTEPLACLIVIAGDHRPASGKGVMSWHIAVCMVTGYGVSGGRWRKTTASAAAYVLSSVSALVPCT